MPRRLPSSPFLKRLFNEYNEKFYYGRLEPETIVRWANQGEMRRACNTRSKRKQYWGLFGYESFDGGETYVPVIRIDDMLRRRRWLPLTKLTLHHEMSHQATGGRDNHGPAFDRKMLSLALRGAFAKLW